MRYSIFLGALLLALGTQGRADESNIDRAYFSIQVAAGDDSAPRVKSTGSRVIELNQRSPNVVPAESPASNVRHNDTQPSNAVTKDAPSDNVLSRETPRSNILHFEESVPKFKMRSPNDNADATAAAAPVAADIAASAPALPKSPDERPLWRMLDNQHYAALFQKLDRLRVEFPRWRPPAQLVLLAREAWLAQRIEQLNVAEDAAGLIALAHEQPAAFSCKNVVFAWSLAAAHARLNQPVKVDTVVRRLLNCPNEDDRLATLYKAKAWMDADGWVQLLTLEENMPRSLRGEQKFQQMRYDHGLEKFAAASDKEDRTEAQRLFAALASDIDMRKDFAAALLGAWNHFQLAQYEAAAVWFERVLAWDSSQHEARRGLALCALQQKRLDAALMQAEAMPAQATGRAELLRDILVAQAQEAYGAGKYDHALKLIGSAHATLPRHAQLLAAWSNMELGNLDTATGEFIRLYREIADLESAQGVLNSFTRAGRDHELKQLAQTEPLSALVNRHYATRAFADKRFLAARTLAPEQYGALGGVAAPQLSLLTATRSKSGTDGLSRLDLQWQASIEAALPVGSMGEFSARIDRVRLDSGTLPDNALVGRYPLVPAPYAHPATTAATGWQPKLIWRDESTRSWQTELGATPSGGAVSAQWTGRLAYQDRSDKAHWQLNAYREPVRESILSYTGLRDPYQGATWGRVLRNGALANAQVRLNQRWSMNAQASAERLTGDHVADNQRFATEAGIAYNFKFAGFDYAVLGAAITTDQFSKNLSQFTYGHGGYFSPQRYWRLGPSFDFMTGENRNFVMRGRASVGRTGKHEDAAPFFPLAPDGRTYGENSGIGNAYDVEFSAVWRVSNHVQVGALMTKRHSPQYNDHAMLGFVRILLEPRKAALSSDLRTSAGKDLY